MEVSAGVSRSRATLCEMIGADFRSIAARLETI